MSRLELRLSLEAMKPILGRLLPLVRELRQRHANPVSRGEYDDAELRELLAESLLDEQRSDLEAFQRLFGPEFALEGHIVLDEPLAESVLRACAALRLRLRETTLAAVPDSALETGDLPFDQLGEAEKLAYASYAFLAMFQELIIEFLDPGSRTSGEG